jgi:hypothetical protein
MSHATLVRDQVSLKRGMASVVIHRYADLLTIFPWDCAGVLNFEEKSFASPGLISGPHNYGIDIPFLEEKIFCYRRSRIDLLRGRSTRFINVADVLQDVICDIRDAKGLMAGSMLMTMLVWVTHALRIAIMDRAIAVVFHILVGARAVNRVLWGEELI